MKQIILLVLFVLIFSGLFTFPIKVTSWNAASDIKLLNQLNVSVDYFNPDTQTIIAYVYDENGFNKILSSGLNAVRIPDLAKDYADSLWNATKDTSDPLNNYYTLNEYISFLQNTATQYPSLCQLIQFGTSAGGYPLYFLKISDNVTVQENEPEFRYVSSMHGDEVVGYDMCIRLIQLLTSQYTTTTRIAEIVDNTEIWICPMLNPDGYIAHSRYNNNGADLNRNFPLPVGSQHPDGMATQPETTAIMNHSNEQSTTLSANFHGGALVANYPWDYIYPLCPDNNLFIQLALAYSMHNTPMYNSTEFDQGITNGAAWYIAEGSLQDWVYANNGDMDVTVELSNTKWPSYTTLDTYWSQNQESMLTLLEFVRKGVYGTVTNNQGQPLTATIHVNNGGIDVQTDPQVGDYHRVLLPGTYSITVSATGYQTEVTTINVDSGSATLHDFVLQPVIMIGFSGTVISLTGNPVANATLKLRSGPSVFQAVTDNNGQFAFTDLPSGPYTLTVTAEANGVYASDFILNSDNNKQILVMPAPLFNDSFGNGASNWTLSAPWALTNQSGNFVLTDSPTGNYSNNLSLDASLTSPFSLSNVNNPTLSFKLKYNLENNYDFLHVLVSGNNSSWTELASYTGAQTSWQNIQLSLSEFSGTNCYLKFRLTTDTGVTADGVYLDDIIISGLASDMAVYGDTDANWMINAKDYQNILEYSVGNNPIPEIDEYPWEAFRLEAADVDNDGSITATDAYYIYDRFESYSGAFPAQNGNNINFMHPILVCTTGEQSNGFYFSSDYQYLKALTLSFSADSELTVNNLDLANTDPNIITFTSSDRKIVSLLVKNGADVSQNLLEIYYTTDSEHLYCNGIINSFPVSVGGGTTSNADNTGIIGPTALLGNYPNPFSCKTSIRWNVAKDNTHVKISVYNTKGQLVKTLVNSSAIKGPHTFDLNPAEFNLSNGIYYLRMEAGDFSKTSKMLLIR